jgi:hypothetical protein
MPVIIGPINGSNNRRNPAGSRKNLIVLSLVLAAAGFVSLIETRVFLSKAIRTTATVVELRKESGGGFRAIFQYEDTNGQTFTKASPSTANPPLRQIGDTAGLAYKPSTPSRARIVDSWQTYLWTISLLTPAVILLIVAAGLPRKQKELL